jgi:hypothetical protein
LQSSEALIERGAVAQRLLRGSISQISGFVGEAKQAVCRRDDVLYFGTCLGI